MYERDFKSLEEQSCYLNKSHYKIKTFAFEMKNN